MGHLLTSLYIGAGISLASCSAVPQFRDDPRITPADVAMRVQCELKIAMQDPVADVLGLDNYIVQYGLGLKVESDANPNVSAVWTIPYHLTDTFKLSPTAGVDDYVLRDSSVKYAFALKDLKDYPCPDYLEQAYRNDRNAAQISYGSFGLIDWMNRVASSAPAANSVPTTLDYYTVKFAVTGTVNPSPGFAIVNLNGTVNLPLKRIDTDTLNVVFIKSLPEKPQKVCVLNLPNATACPPPKPGPKETKEEEAPAEQVRRLQGKPPKTRKPTVKKTPISPETQERLDRKLENLQLRDILRQ